MESENAKLAKSLRSAAEWIKRHGRGTIRATLDECPMAYKGMKDILDNIGPTARLVEILKPIYNFKAGEES